MKKLVLLAIMALFTFTLHAEEVVATFTMAGGSKDVEAFVDKKGNLKVFVELVGKYKNDHVMLKIEGEKDIYSFISALQYCKEKFIEWDSVAKANKVSEFKKDFDVIFPSVEIWWSGSKWYSSYKRNFIKPIFLVSDGSSSFGCYGKASHYDNEYIDQEFYIIMDNADEIQSLIDALDPVKILNKLNSNTQVDALFQ